MKSLRLSRTSRTSTCLIATVSLLAIGSAFAQRDRITHVLDNYTTVVVPGHLNPMAKAEFDRGAVPGSFVLRGMTLTVRRTAAQQRDLNRLLAAQQNPSSPQYHKWLAPEAFANRFGASPNDLATLQQWLESQGFQIKAVARGRTFIRFDATAAQVRDAFGTEIHHYSVNGVLHYANSSEPSLPSYLVPLVLAVGGMNDFTPRPSNAQLVASKSKVKAQYTLTTGGNSVNTLAPGDVATIYDLVPLQTASGVNYGEGQTVMVIGMNDVTAGDLTAYCGAFSLTCTGTLTQTFPAGDGDPGTGDGTQGATVDLELVSAVAPAANLVLDADGVSVWNALSDAVDKDLGQVILMSYGQCEATVGQSAALGIQATVQAANAQGITVIAASGDTGAAGCDSEPLTAATGGLAVNVPADIPEVTGVGGTEFTDQSSTYWSSSTGMALSYIPETSWNDTFGSSNQHVAATGGGVSTVFTTTPSWQSGTTGVLTTGRNVPDVALSGSPFTDPYMAVVTMSGTQQTAPMGGGTEASAAVFAGIVALMNESQGATGLGNINPTLYAIAGGSNGYSGSAPAFHDITTGSNIVPCANPSTDCPSSAPYQLGYSAGTGYDQATGLGSVDAQNLNLAWTAAITPAITGLSVSTATAGHADLSVTITGNNFTNGSTVKVDIQFGRHDAVVYGFERDFHVGDNSGCASRNGGQRPNHSERGQPHFRARNIHRRRGPGHRQPFGVHRHRGPHRPLRDHHGNQFHERVHGDVDFQFRNHDAVVCVFGRDFHVGDNSGRRSQCAGPRQHPGGERGRCAFRDLRIHRRTRPSHIGPFAVCSHGERHRHASDHRGEQLLEPLHRDVDSTRLELPSSAEFFSVFWPDFHVGDRASYGSHNGGHRLHPGGERGRRQFHARTIHRKPIGNHLAPQPVLRHGRPQRAVYADGTRQRIRLGREDRVEWDTAILHAVRERHQPHLPDQPEHDCRSRIGGGHRSECRQHHFGPRCLYHRRRPGRQQRQRPFAGFHRRGKRRYDSEHRGERIHEPILCDMDTQRLGDRIPAGFFVSDCNFHDGDSARCVSRSAGHRLHPGGERGRRQFHAQNVHHRPGAGNHHLPQSASSHRRPHPVYADGARHRIRLEPADLVERDGPDHHGCEHHKPDVHDHPGHDRQLRIDAGHRAGQGGE